MKKYFNLLFLLFILFASILSSEPSVKVMNQFFHHNVEAKKDSLVIVIDPGHGGRDPGKVGINNILEKDINLSISLKLKKLLELNDIQVVMTRTEEVGLYDEGNSNKKRADMNARVEIIKNANADLAISIHQNSFPQENVKGAQVFYHVQSQEGKRLAEILQDQIVKTIADGNHRKAKSNDNYFMLKYTQCPLVIVECGYLTNYREANLLKDEDYQERMAYAIHLGIMRYINESGLGGNQT